MADPATVPPSSATPAVAHRFDEIVVPELEVLLRVARSITGNPDDAEDLLQDTLLRAYRGLDTFDGSHPRAWLLTIMRNAHVNGHRRRRPTLLRGTDDAPDARREVAPSAEDVASATWIDGPVDRAVSRLSPRLRETIRLVDVEGLTYDEAATVLGVPVGTVMSRLHRARRSVRDRLHHRPGSDGRTP